MFKVGDEVAYGLHGKCVITGIETKELAAGQVCFYQVRTLKNPILSKNLDRSGPQILIPVDGADLRGLRPLMSKLQAEELLRTLVNPDTYFDLNMTWVTKQKILEESIRKEGALGLTKVVGHLYVLTKQDAVPPTDILRFFNSAYKVFLRELSESLELPSKDVEALVNKALKTKLLNSF